MVRDEEHRQPVGAPPTQAAPPEQRGDTTRANTPAWLSSSGRDCSLRTRWDVALLANLAGGDGPVRPVDLISAVNAQSDDGQLGWKVMEDRLRHLEASGYIARRKVPRGPREFRYWLLPPGAAC